MSVVIEHELTVSLFGHSFLALMRLERETSINYPPKETVAVLRLMRDVGDGVLEPTNINNLTEDEKIAVDSLAGCKFLDWIAEHGDDDV